ncbi:membrane protein [Gordonia phage Elinal]|nr:membrane protein [Gordonia phage Elinal]
MSSTQQPATPVTVGPSFGGLLFLVLLTLKLTGVIDWSWWWVTAPLWIGAIAAVLFAVFLLIVILLTKDD